MAQNLLDFADVQPGVNQPVGTGPAQVVSAGVFLGSVPPGALNDDSRRLADAADDAAAL